MSEHPVIAARHGVRIERNVRIPVRDGARLAADLVRPDEEGRFPAVIEYLPYRKDDNTAAAGDVHHYLAERGFVGVRLDVRGTGGSDGVNTDEYVPQEQEDGCDAVEWVARQPWCNGRVGMFGSSYGGFTALQVAMHRPPSLKAIVPLYATDDRYTDDCHYTPGGNLRMYYDVGCYGGLMVAMNALPPVPEFAGEAWAEMWQRRLEENEPYIPKWLAQQTDGSYWRPGSLRPGYERIACPVFLIGGWRDGYANPMLRMAGKLRSPCKLLMGPWTHTRPNTSVPGPRIDYLNEVARFFAHWLRDEETGIMREPAVAVHMQEYARPERTLDVVPGAWRAEASFPVQATRERTYFLDADGRLSGEPSKSEDAAEFEYRPTVGLANGFWSGGGITYYLADDQRADEAYSLTWTSAPFAEDVHILGWPEVILHGSASMAVATFVAKLADVAPDGSSCLIVDGSLNGTRRRSLSDPMPLTPDEVYELAIPMTPTGWTVKRGHRLRLAVSGADFPNLWPTPLAGRQRVHWGGHFASRVVLPVVSAASLPLAGYLSPPRLHQAVKSFTGPPRQEVSVNHGTGVVSVHNHLAKATSILPGVPGTFALERRFTCSASSTDPAHASVVGTHTYTLEREDGTFMIDGESTIRSSATAFHVTINLNVMRNGRPFFHKTWTATEPRRLL
jgi:putative CocE/NonD family hydrolase